MKLRLKKIPIAHAVAGMLVAVPVISPRGDVLVQAGCELTDFVISGLRKRGIDRISIHIEDGRSEEELVIERDKVRDRMHVLFRNAGANEQLASLYQLMLEFRLGSLS